jgi:Flp pilus assembly protein TadG
MMTTLRTCRSFPPRRARRGQSLVEFALVALVVYLLFAATIEYGRLFFGAQTMQSVADFTARELSRAPISATGPDPSTLNTPFLLNYYLSTGDASSDQDVQYVRTYIYTEDYLAIDLTNWMSNPANSGETLLDYIDKLTPAVPPVNKLLLPLMFVSYMQGQGSSGQGVPLLRFPGALVTSTTAPSGYTVKVPLVVARAPVADPRGSNIELLGAETIIWKNVVEAIPFSDNSGTQYDVFSVASGSSGTGVPAGGLAAVRVNYPFQAATMASYPYNPNQPFVVQSDPTTFRVINPNTANDSQVSSTDPNNFLNGGQPVAPSVQTGFYSGTYGGQYGLGTLGAVDLQVRPFRKTISCQAIYRREVFGP